MAGRAGVPLIGLVRHRGRRSGTMYLAPVAIGTTETVSLIPLTFGPRSDWCRNVLDAGVESLEDLLDSECAHAGRRKFDRER
jgi:hypothetical protein